MQDNRIVKMAVLGTLRGENGRGQPVRKWLNDVVKWTGIHLKQLMKVTQSRQE